LWPWPVEAAYSRRTNHQFTLVVLIDLYSMKIKEQTRKLAVGCSKHCFEVVDRTDEVSNIYTARRS
ncbi:hypothetical protein, partial [Streptococcus pneumoniae]|uniref:hypothetical protein n=1 Tax=Streptococcus pneumoniae TaxID=1313 RepID=UPI0029660BD5